LEQKEQILARDASERLDNTQHEVRVLDEHYAALASRITLLTQRIESVEEWWRRATGLRDSISAYADEASDGLDDVANALVQSSERLADNLESHARTLRSDQEDLDQRLQLLRHEIQPLRDRLDRASAGLGATTAELRTLRANEADLQGMLATLPRLRKEQERVQALRDELMRSRQIRREERARRRADAAADVQDMLGPRVQVTVRQFSDSRSIKYLMDSMLRGSGLRYSTISETLANSFLPEQLINLVERGDAKTAAALSGMPTDRIARVLSMLNEPEFLSALCEADLEDDVDFLLADHGQLKSIENLSTGQKCATLLPVLLTDMDRCLILDQPEDHLDTTYLIETVVRQMARRSKVGAQTIVITHNPNIPVLGEAELVVRLQSDGHRARIESEGVFSDPLVAKGILQLMEGGREAFSRRAAFYKASI